MTDQEATDNMAAARDDDDLRESQQGLSGLSVKALNLDQLLTSVAKLAVRAIPGADGAGLTLLEAERPNTIVATTAFVSEIDDIQYSLGQGPCISAAADGATIRSGSLGADPRWPRFGGRIARLGVHSVLSLPLIVGDTVLGAMNVYAHAKNVFDERAATLGEMYAVPAAISVQNAQVLAEAQRFVARLESVLADRRIVERAIGIMMSRGGGTAEDALDRLRTASQHEHVKLVELARTMVDEAVRRADARRAGHDGRRP
ncbi:MAG: GAF and ANTAR domain-containing protein [Propionibacteriaceae bacterium]